MKKIILFILTMLIAFNARANSNVSFKMAVIKGTDGASLIHKGNYEKGIDSIASEETNLRIGNKLATQVNLCVAYSNSKQYDKAVIACDEAIVLSKSIAETEKSAVKFLSISLNNRAILKAKTQDFKGALEDLIAASQIKNISFVEGNLLKLIHDQAESIQFESMQLTQR